MRNKSALLLILIIIIATASVLSIIQNVKAVGKIYIKSDGSISPTNATIVSTDNRTYTVFGDINNTEGVVIERNNIILDGANHTIQGTRVDYSKGIELSYRSNVTIRNLIIRDFYYGVYLANSLNSTVSWNNVTANTGIGIYILYSMNNSIYCNNVTSCFNGIKLEHSSVNTLWNNKMSGNTYNFDVWGTAFSSFLNNVSSSNRVGGKPIYYLINAKDLTVPFEAGHVTLINCTRVTIKNSNITHNKAGILLVSTSNSTITGNALTNDYYSIQLHNQSNNNSISRNTITNDDYGIYLYNSSNNILASNNITANRRNGIWLYSYCSNNTIAKNNIVGNDDGVRVDWHSNYNRIVENNVASNQRHGVWMWENSNFTSVIGNNLTANNYLGIELEYSSYCTIAFNNIASNKVQGINLYASSNDSIFGNSIKRNSFAIFMAYSSNSSIFHNNLVDNTAQVYVDSISTNMWNNSLEGNYWSNYTGVDSDHDGIGDTSHVINVNNLDAHPLMGTFHSFNTSKGINVDIVSNSSIKNFQYFECNRTIRMRVSNATANQTFGFCRITIPTALIPPPYYVITDEGQTQVSYNRTVAENQTHKWIYFAYENSVRNIDILPEFSSPIILAIFMVITLWTIAIYIAKKEHT